MDIAIVTGASSTLGQAISRRLIELGFRVYGLGGDYSHVSLQNRAFIPVPCDLSNPTEVDSQACKILKKEQAVVLLVNNARYNPPGSITEMKPEQIERAYRINFFTPLIILRRILPSLQKLRGQVINLGPLEADANQGGLLGAAAAGAMRWLSTELFLSYRDHGVRVCQISPEANRNRTEEDRRDPYNRRESVLDPEAVANAVKQVINLEGSNVVTEVIVRPQRTRELDLEPVRKLPNPDPLPVPYTVPREWIEAEDHLEDERLEKEDQEKEAEEKKAASKKKPTVKAAAEDAGPDAPATKSSAEHEADSEGDSPKRKRRRRRRGKRSGDSTGSSPQTRRDDASRNERPEPGSQPEPQSESIKGSAAKEDEASRRKRRGRKPRPPKLETPAGVALSKEETPERDAEPTAVKEDPTAPVAGGEPPAPGEPKKKAARKAAKKVGKKKSATKKTAAKKAPAKKSATKKTAAKKTTKKAATKKTTAKKATKKAARKEPS